MLTDIRKYKRHLLIGTIASVGLLVGTGLFYPEYKMLLFAAASILFASSLLAVIAVRSLRVWRIYTIRIATDISALRADIDRLHALFADRPRTEQKQSKRGGVKYHGGSLKKIDEKGDVEAGKTLLVRAINNAQSIIRDRKIHPKSKLRTEKANEPPQISVVVPLFNEERFVAATIDSLKRQTLKDFEAIIVDDASTDGSMAVVMAAVKDDDRFKITRHSVNSGLSAARNTGIRIASAPLITFLDSDDFLFPDALATRVSAIENLENTPQRRFFAGVWCRLVTMPQNISLDEAMNRLPNRNVKMEPVDFVSSGGECPFNAHAPTLFLDVVRHHGGFDETLKYGCEDWDLWQRIMRNGYSFAPTGRLSGVYRRKRGSMVKETPQEHLETARILLKSARAPMRPEDLSENAPCVFREGVHFYQDQLSFLRRLAQFATINSFASKEALAKTLSSMPTSADAYIDDQRDLVPYIEAGIRRSIALDETSIDALRESFDVLVALIIDLIHSYTFIEDSCQLYSSISYDTVFFPQTQAQVRIMAPTARALLNTGCRIIFVTTEVETGDQGQRAALAKAELPTMTFNTANLKGISARSAVLMRPYSSLIRDCIPVDANIVEIVDEACKASLPDNNTPRKDVTTTEPSEAATAISAFFDTDEKSFLVKEGVLERAREYCCAPQVISKEESFFQTVDYELLHAMKNKWRGERCVIIGNGPSINQTDLTKLKNEFTFAVNGIFYKSAEMGFDPTFYIVEDSAVMKENIDAIASYRSHYKLFPTLYRKLYPKTDNVAFFMMNRGFYEKQSPHYCIPRFSIDAARRVYCGQSVTHINLQLAYYFGFSEVYLIGVDFSYVIPNSAIRTGDLIVSTEDDPNHFHGDYFGKGKTWKDPKLHRVKLNYELARDMFAADDRKVYNATKGGALEVFERADYDTVF